MTDINKMSDEQMLRLAMKVASKILGREITELPPRDPKLEALLSLARKVEDFLESVKDQGTEIDTGYDFTTDTRELFVTVDGIEYRIKIDSAEIEADVRKLAAATNVE